MFLSIIIPAYNEEGSITKAIRQIHQYFSKKQFDFEIIVVDDGSQDRTAWLIRGEQRNYKNIIFLQNEINRGKGYSVRRGALASSGEWILFLDADLSTKPEEFEKLTGHLADFDIVIGSRAVRGANIVCRQSLARELAGRLANKVIRLYLSLDYHDTQCGFKLFHRRTKKIFNEQKLDGWLFDAELLYLAKLHGFKVKEIPIQWTNDPTTTVNSFGFIQALRELYFIQKSHTRAKRWPYAPPLIILIVAFAVRLIFFSGIISVSGEHGFYPSKNEDSLEYISLAENIIAGNGFSRGQVPPYAPEIFRTPGYPGFIALIFSFVHRVSAVIIVQNLLFIFLIYYVYTWITKNFKNNFIASISAFFLALDPSIVYWNNQISSETLFAVTLFFSLFIFHKFLENRRYYLLLGSGGLFGYLLLTRPIAQYLFIIFVFGIVVNFIRNKNWKFIVVSLGFFFISFFVIISPWLIRNKIQFGSYKPSATSIIAFGKYLTAMKNERGEELDKIESANRLERSEARKDQAIQYILKHPLLFLKIHFLSFLPFFGGDGYFSAFSAIFPEIESDRLITDWGGNLYEFKGYFNQVVAEQKFTIFIVGKLFRIIIIIFFISGILEWFKNYRTYRMTLTFLLLIIYYFALATGIGSYSRFRFPVDPYIYIIAAFGLDSARNSLKKLF